MKKAVLLLFPIIAFAYFPFYIEEFETTKVYLFTTFACFAAFYVDWKILKHDRVAQALALLTVSAAVSTIFSIDQHVSLYGNIKCRAGLLVYISYLVFYLAARSQMKKYPFDIQVIEMFSYCSLGVSAYAILQAFGIDFKDWKNTLVAAQYMRPMSSLGHPNFMAAYLTILLPFGLWRLDTLHKHHIHRVIQLFITWLSIAAIWLSLSRGMLIAAALGFATYLFISKAKRTTMIKVAISTALIASTALLVSPVFRNTALDRMQSLFDPGPARLEYPTAAVRMWQKAPLLGVGTDNYEIAFRNQRTKLYWQVERSGSPHKAHNDFLNTLATQGLFGAVASILIMLAIIMRLIKRRKSPFIAPCAASIVVFYVQGLTSFTVVAVGMVFIMSTVLLEVRDA